jgi:hypothetical protein
MAETETIWLSFTKYPYIKWQWIFYFLRITAKTVTGFGCICEQHGGRLIRSKNCIPFASTRVHLQLFGGFRVSHLFIFFYVGLLCVFTF